MQSPLPRFTIQRGTNSNCTLRNNPRPILRECTSLLFCRTGGQTQVFQNGTDCQIDDVQPWRRPHHRWHNGPVADQQRRRPPPTGQPEMLTLDPMVDCGAGNHEVSDAPDATTDSDALQGPAHLATPSADGVSTLIRQCVASGKHELTRVEPAVPSCFPHGPIRLPLCTSSSRVFSPWQISLIASGGGSITLIGQPSVDLPGVPHSLQINQQPNFPSRTPKTFL